MSERDWNWERQRHSPLDDAGVPDAGAMAAPVLAGVMLPATGPAVEAARQAAGERADALVVGSPNYLGVEPAAQEHHVEAVLAATPLPALLYNIPQCTHHVLSADTGGRLAGDPRVLGIKDSAGDLEAFQALLAIKRERPHFRVLEGQAAAGATGFR